MSTALTFGMKMTATKASCRKRNENKKTDTEKLGKLQSFAH